jgi:NAD(P)-dependent dehydrogenase (short-subunit alcohol dehydrogenase family)
MKADAHIAIVTGAGSGIGRAVAHAFIGAGYRVALAGRSEDALRETADGTPLDQLLIVPTDVRDPSAVAELFARVANAWKRVDVVFNNAGISGPAAPIDDVAPEQWDAVIATNLTGVFLCAQEAFRTMKRQVPQGGRIINSGSISAQTPRPHAIAYTASKHGVTGLTKAISLEGRAYDIACGQIDVGNAVTEMTAPMGAGVIQADGTVAPEPRIPALLIAESVLYMAGLPLDANVQSLTVMATKMPFIGRG